MRSLVTLSSVSQRALPSDILNFSLPLELALFGHEVRAMFVFGVSATIAYVGTYGRMVDSMHNSSSSPAVFTLSSFAYSASVSLIGLIYSLRGFPLLLLLFSTQPTLLVHLTSRAAVGQSKQTCEEDK